MDTSEGITAAASSAVLVTAARAEAGLSQRQLAERAGTSQPAVARYEAGRVVPDLATLSRLLTACGLSLRLGAVPLDPHDLRRLREAVTTPPALRVAANRRATRLAAQAARARAGGRVRRLGHA